MGVITEDIIVNQVVGLICDKCGVEDYDGFNNFFVEHVFGFGSKIDGDKVSFALCDECLEEIAKKEIPKAKWE